MKYRTIVADPPWAYPSPGGHLRATAEHRPNSHDKGVAALGADSHSRYGSMTTEELCALQPPVEDNAHLHLWATNAFLEDAHQIVRAWGFRPITVCTWGKVQPDGRPSMKVGHYFRGATEHWVFGVRGSLALQTSEALPTLWLWPRIAHSEKPDAFYDLVEKVSPGPYLELFARRQRLGWDTWGNEALNHVDLEAGAA